MNADGAVGQRWKWPVTLAGIIALATCIDWSHEYWSVALPQACALLLLVMWSGLFLAGRESCRVPFVFLPVAAMSLWGVGQIFFGSTVSAYTTEQAVVLWMSCAAFAWLGANTLAGQAARELFLSCVLSFGTLIAVLAVVQFYTAPNTVFWLIPAQTPIGPFIYKNHFAAFVELLFPVAIFRIVVDPRRATVWGVFAAALFGAVVVSASRGGSVLLFAELVTILAIGITRRWIPARRAWLLTLQVPLLLALSVGIFGWQSISEHFQESSSISVRKELVRSTAEMIAERPLAGHGLGTWAMTYPRFAHFDNTQFANEAHNDWMQWAADGGIPFALLMLPVAFWSLRQGLRHPWALGPFAILVHSVFDYPLRDPAVLALTFLLLGAADTQQLPEGTSSPRHQRTRERRRESV